MQRFHSPSGLEETPIGRLYQRFWQAIFLLIRQFVASQEDAEDILLDVFLAAMESQTLLNMSELQQIAWLRRVAYNKCMDFHRQKTRHPTSVLDDYAETLYDDETQVPEQIALRQEELVQLRKHLDILTLDQQKILRLRFTDELPCAQIAVRMNKSEGAIYSTGVLLLFNASFLSFLIARLLLLLPCCKLFGISKSLCILSRQHCLEDNHACVVFVKR